MPPKNMFGRVAVLLLLASSLVLTSCTAAQMHSTASPEVKRNQSLSGLPYAPLVYHLDLSVMAYQLYSQTLVWPFTPYYEEFANRGGERARFMEKVRTWARVKGAEQVKNTPRLGGYRGPGRLAGFADNPRNDPIVMRYDRIYPWSRTITNPDDRWTEYMPPEAITRQIRDVFMCYRKTARPEGSVAIEHVASGRGANDRGARDVLLAFEGGTGDKGEAGQPASQSLMGFVLLRHLPNSEKYDVHIAFRGSRSGSGARAVVQAISGKQARGNPDWVTDLGYFRIGPDEGAGSITTVGEVHRGFAKSMESTLPQIFGCLNKAADLAHGAKPNNIYVTGHSLGGGLAQHFASAVLLGNQYGPGGSGSAMPNKLRKWPWKQIKLITYSAPTAGNTLWAETLTKRELESSFFNTVIEPIDLKALSVIDPSILPRLVDRQRPAGYRVLISTDPITTTKGTDGKHVGETVYANKLDHFSPFAVAEINSHEPEEVRSLLLDRLADPRIPGPPLRYLAMDKLNPERRSKSRATLGEFEKLKSAIDRYYLTNALKFDHAGFARDFDIFSSLVRAE